VLALPAILCALLVPYVTWPLVGQVLALLTPVLYDSKSAPLDVVAHAALALGMVFVSSCHEDAARAILQALEERSAQLSEPLGRFLALGLALLFLGEQVRAHPLHIAWSQHSHFLPGEGTAMS